MAYSIEYAKLPPKNIRKHCLRQQKNSVGDIWLRQVRHMGPTEPRLDLGKIWIQHRVGIDLPQGDSILTTLQRHVSNSNWPHLSAMFMSLKSDLASANNKNCCKLNFFLLMGSWRDLTTADDEGNVCWEGKKLTCLLLTDLAIGWRWQLKESDLL